MSSVVRTDPRGDLQSVVGGRVAVRRVLGDETVQSSVQCTLGLGVSLWTRLEVVDVDRGGRTERDDGHASVVAVDGEVLQHVLLHAHD